MEPRRVIYHGRDTHPAPMQSPPTSLTGLFPIEKSALYQFYLREQEEIARHKWVLSEQMGSDCGWDYARWNWLTRARQNWILTLKASGEKVY